MLFENVCEENSKMSGIAVKIKGQQLSVGICTEAEMVDVGSVQLSNDEWHCAAIIFGKDVKRCYVDSVKATKQMKFQVNNVIPVLKSSKSMHLGCYSI